MQYKDNAQRTIPAWEGINIGLEHCPKYEGYELLGCIGGHGDGNLGLIVYDNGWVFNSNGIELTYNGITWQLLYVKK